ncbi:hypothetical protein NW762_007054 [Fusarium torreyae]|uniref:Uncharacterized protein n=1 Tax=Fusarium torreyae TaxID=1237075 RepID=A0A9W8VES3_9HYPO|nr:hypothetical protein NW762_007054 [Fusarium torreyae]
MAAALVLLDGIINMVLLGTAGLRKVVPVTDGVNPGPEDDGPVELNDTVEWCLTQQRDVSKAVHELSAAKVSFASLQGGVNHLLDAYQNWQQLYDKVKTGDLSTCQKLQSASIWGNQNNEWLSSEIVYGPELSLKVWSETARKTFGLNMTRTQILNNHVSMLNSPIAIWTTARAREDI